MGFSACSRYTSRALSYSVTWASASAACLEGDPPDELWAEWVIGRLAVNVSGWRADLASAGMA
jgi:hypothetical protein